MRCSARPGVGTSLAAVWLAVACTAGQAQMPDVSAMSGLAIPAPELPDGTVTVRVVRGEITNNIPGVEVELHGAGVVRTARTGTDGRAQFSGVSAGALVQAAVVVDGRRLESSRFQVPARGGVRTLLAAVPGKGESSAKEGTAATPRTPVDRGTAGLSIGPNSRIAIEFAEDVLQVFYLLEIVNRSAVAITPSGPLTFDMPDAAQSTSVLDRSTPQAVARGDQVIVTGPFAPGVTPVQIAYRVDSFGDSLTLRQEFPVPIDMLMTAVQKVGDMRVSSPQIARAQEAPIQNTTYIMGTGPGLAAGTPFVLSLTGLPHHDRTPLWATLALVAAIIAAGVWLALSPEGSDATAARRHRLEARRADGLAALAALESERGEGRIDDATYAARRTALFGQLERLYAELDEREGAVPSRDVA
jgi:hypothetical protein